MKNLIVCASAILGLAAADIVAARCDAHFTFDGNLSDTSGNGFEGRMIGREGAVAEPQFVEGRFGQALQLDGTSAMRAFVDLHFDRCPQVSVAAWVQVDAAQARGVQHLVSTGSGNGPGLRASGAHLVLNGTGNGLMQRDSFRPNGGWMFVAGVYDFANGTYTLYSRNRSIDGALAESRRPPEEALWVGALNDELSGPAAGVVIDDLRIYGKLLSEDEIRALQAGTAAPVTVAATNLESRGAVCAVHTDCGAGNYCALDSTCHPDSHAPIQSLVLSAVDGPVQSGGFILSEAARAADSGSSRGLDADIPSAPNITFESGGTLSGEARDRLISRASETRPPDITYASEEEAIAAAAAAAARRQTEIQAEASPAPETSGPYAMGTPTFTAIAGWAGGMQRRIDLGAEFLDRIKLGGPSGRCRIEANGQALDLCGSSTSDFPYIEVSLPGSVIGRIEVCGSGAVQGIRVWGDVVDADGTIRYEPAADEGQFPFCRELANLIDNAWSASMLCPNGHVGSGLVVHASDVGAFSDVIVGLQLICRRVGVR